jgi:hypothetical protein
LFMQHLKDVEVGDDGRSYWVADGPAGSNIKWTAEIINEIHDELIAWKSLPGGDVDTAGSVRFKDAPGGRGTEIHVELQYNPPAGRVGALVAKLFGKDPQREIGNDLRRLKQYLESGEVATDAGSAARSDCMKALCWYGSGDVRVETVPDPQILNPHDAIVKITLTAICGSDLHIYNGFIPGMERGDILGHEFMGEVVEVGAKVERLKKGDRVVVPFTICCGKCHYCKEQLWSLCDNTNPMRRFSRWCMARRARACLAIRIFTAGTPAARPICACAFCRCRPDRYRERLLGRTGSLSLRHFPYGLHGRRELQYTARRCGSSVGVRPGGAIRYPQRLHARAERVIAIDHVRERLDMAKDISQAEVLDYASENVLEGVERTDRRTGTGFLYRRGRYGSAWQHAGTRLRPDEASALSRNRPAQRFA